MAVSYRHTAALVDIFYLYLIFGKSLCFPVQAMLCIFQDVVVGFWEKKGVYVSARVVRQQISVGRASAGCGSSPGHHHTFFSLLSLLGIQLEI